MTESLPLLTSLDAAGRQLRLHFERDTRAQHPVDERLSAQDAQMIRYLRARGAQPAKELARAFAQAGSTLTGRLDRLEQQGLLMRLPNPRDRRSSLLLLTDAGMQRGQELRARAEELEARISALVGERDLRGFRAVLDAIEQTTRIAAEVEEGA